MKHDTAIAELSRTKNPVAEQLRAAQELIRDPEHWCQGALFRDAHGTASAFHNVERRCAIGALHGSNATSTADLLNEAAKEMGFLQRRGELCAAAMLNDHTDHATVMEMFDLAIEKAEAEHV